MQAQVRAHAHTKPTHMHSHSTSTHALNPPPTTHALFPHPHSNMDRVNMSVAILPMKAQFGWDSTTMGFVQSSFFWGYLLTQVWGLSGGLCRGCWTRVLVASPLAASPRAQPASLKWPASAQILAPPQ